MKKSNSYTTLLPNREELSLYLMGLYFQPDGPFPNPADLMPAGKIKEAQEAQEEAAEQLCADMVYIGKGFNEMGCEGFNFDTAGSTGDAELYATLKAARQLKQHAPGMSIIIGMASDFVLEVPIDCVSRASKALALIGKADGL
jgi:hypothetical protein